MVLSLATEDIIEQKKPKPNVTQFEFITLLF